MKLRKNGVQIFLDVKREYRWRVWKQGRIVAESGEGYKRKGPCSRAFANMVRYVCSGKLKYLD